MRSIPDLSMLFVASALFLGAASSPAHANTITTLVSEPGQPGYGGGGGGGGGTGGSGGGSTSGSTLYVAATLTGGVTVSGSFQYTAAGEFIDSANLTVASGSASQLYSNYDPNYYCHGTSVCEFQFSDASGEFLNLYLDQSAFGGGPLDSQTDLNLSSLVSGSVSTSPFPAATGVTPEPSSLLLLGTGLVGTMGVLWRRMSQGGQSSSPLRRLG